MVCDFSALRAEKSHPRRSARILLPQAKMWRCDIERGNCVSPTIQDIHEHPPHHIPRKNHMHRYQLALWGLLATLLLAACATVQNGADSSPSGTSLAIDPIVAPATSAAVSTSKPATPTPLQPTAAGQPVAAIQLEKLTDDVRSPVFVTYAGDKSGR